MLRPRGKLDREYPTLSQQSLSRIDRLWQDWLEHAQQPDEAQSYELFEHLEIPAANIASAILYKCRASCRGWI